MSLFDKIGGFGGSEGGSGRSKGGGDGAETGLQSETRAVTGERYNIEPIETIYEAGVPVADRVPDPDTPGEDDYVAGAYARELLESAHLKPGAPVWIGYTADHNSFREAGLKPSALRRHLWITGVTGSGKTTLLRRIMLYLAFGGFGFLWFDPKGKDSRQLIAKLPEHRLDDVVVIDPFNSEYDRTIPINPLEVPAYVDGADRDEEIRERIGLLKAVFAQDDYWGINMEVVTEVFGRAMMRSETDYTIIDLYFILLDQDRRDSFAAQVGDDPILRDAIETISDMDDEELRPTVKRVMSWVLDPTVRQIVAHRNSGIDYREMIAEDKIVIVRTATTNKPLKRMQTLAHMLSAWSAGQRRSYETDRTPKLYPIIADEFDDIESEQLDMKSMLARARSMGMPVVVACQYPSQLHETTLKALKNNAKTRLVFTCEDEDDAEIMMEPFGEYDAGDLLETEDYRLWTKLPLGGGATSNPVCLHTFPPYPNLRPMDAVDDIVRERLVDVGVEKLTLTEILDDIPFDIGGCGLSVGDDGDIPAEHFEVDKSVAATVCKAVYDEALRHGLDGTDPVDADAAAERIRRYLSEWPIDTEAQLIGRVTDNVPAAHLEHVEGDDGTWTYRCTEDGATAFLAQGDNERAGGAGHRSLLVGDQSESGAAGAYDALTRLGFTVDIPSQEQPSLPDGIATLGDHDALQVQADARTVADRVRQWERDHPLLARLSNGRPVHLEAEKSTAGQPSQTLTNLLEALKKGRRCLFLVREEEVDDVLRTLTDPPCTSSQARAGETRFYTHRPLRIGDARDGDRVYRPAGAHETVWARDESTGEYVLRDADREYARFADADAIFDPANADRYPARESDFDEEVNPADEGWVTVPRPIIPERDLTGPDGEPIAVSDLPDWYDIVIVGRDGSLTHVAPDGARTDLDPNASEQELISRLSAQATDDGSVEDSRADADRDSDRPLGRLSFDDLD